jgi:hypothetical protein
MSPDDLSRALTQPGRASIPYLDRYNLDRPLMLECFRLQGYQTRRDLSLPELPERAIVASRLRESGGNRSLAPMSSSYNLHEIPH